ncbi:MAG TPA: S49 family peptidase, partial [Arenibacter sp.]|nr:S49 family peptidase [Arenibacter sp.]
GRVWSGVDAKRLGLVDELGGLDDAVSEAAKIAGIERYNIKNFPKYKSGFEQLMEELGGAGTKGKEAFIEKEIGAEAYSLLKEIKSILENKGAQARMPFTLRIQ